MCRIKYYSTSILRNNEGTHGKLQEQSFVYGAPENAQDLDESDDRKETLID